MLKTLANRLMVWAAASIVLTTISCQPEVTEFSFAFLTDIHVHPERRATEGFQLAIKKVNELEPDFVLTGGDQVSDAFEQGFERADLVYSLYLENAKLFDMPLFNTLGNHDHFVRENNAGMGPFYPEYAKEMFIAWQAQSRYYSFDFKGWHFMVLDSVRPFGRGDYRGGIDAEQMEWITEELAKLEAGTPVVLSTHIPLISVSLQLRGGPGDYRSDGRLVDNAFEVLNLFKGHNLRLVLQGHLHVYEEVYFQGIRFVTGGAVCANWWEGPLREMEEGFLMVRIKGDAIDCEYVDIGWEAISEEG